MVKPKIGLSFSGGGYRAATFDLGVLSFLNSVKLGDGTLLDCVTVLSSVSGGTIPALKYMLAKAQDQPVEDMVKELFSFLRDKDLMDIALKRLSDEKANPELSAIKIMAQIYDEVLFDHKDLGVIMDNFDKIPVKDYTALATDFENSLPFRFRLCTGQMSKWTTVDGKERSRISYAIFGNYENRINRDDARHITPGEALACSSCFPSGFEPMMFPDDFQLSKIPGIAKKYKPSFGLMDGGISDNQGIESLTMAENHLQSHREDKSLTDKMLDLLIVSDVASPYMSSAYAPSGPLKFMGKLTIGRLRNYGLITAGVFALLLVLALVCGSGFWSGVLAVILAIVGLLNIGGCLLKKKMYSAIGKTFVGNRATFISHMKLDTMWNLLMNRATSLIMMSSEVFLKRLRQLAYDSIYSDRDWKNRVIKNTVYALREGENWESRNKNNTIPEDLVPSDELQENSDKAASMGTTLWFTEEDKANGMPEALFTAGQYTICYNLLAYIDKIMKDSTNLTPAHNSIIALKDSLLQAWKKFQKDPQWMLPK